MPAVPMQSGGTARRFCLKYRKLEGIVEFVYINLSCGLDLVTRMQGKRRVPQTLFMGETESLALEGLIWCLGSNSSAMFCLYFHF